MRRMTLVLAALLASTSAWASTHWVIISTVRTSPKSTARINVSATEPDVVRFTAFNAVGAPVFDEMPLSSSFFVSSASSDMPEIQNFFNVYPDEPGMVQAQATQSHTAVMVEQSSPDGKVILNVPPIDKARGIKFLVPIGELHQGTSLLIGNPNDQATAVAIRYGLNPLQPDISIEPFGVGVIDLVQGNTLVVIEARDASLPVIAQIAVDMGKTTIMHVLDPLPF